MIATSIAYGTGGGRSAAVIVFRDLAPLLTVGFIAAFFLSPWSPLTPSYRSRTALLLSVALFVVSAATPQIGFISEQYFAAAISTFGFAFAISRIRTAPEHRSPTGWIFAVVHALLISAALQSLYARAKEAWHHI